MASDRTENWIFHFYLDILKYSQKINFQSSTNRRCETEIAIFKINKMARE